jgi:phosphoribosylformimino-5-aminoimidazole carboxamide ribotide isomerase
MVKLCENWGVRAIIFTDISRDGTQQGPSLSSTGRLAQASRLPVIAAGGIATLDDVRSLAPLEKDGLAGMITGRAIYSGSLNLSEAIDWLKKNTARSNFFIDN